jgi:hypothetical protein
LIVCAAELAGGGCATQNRLVRDLVEAPMHPAGVIVRLLAAARSWFGMVGRQPATAPGARIA